MRRLIISPYSRRIAGLNRNPKDYPWWDRLVHLLKSAGYHLTQIGVTGEKVIPQVDECLFDLPIPSLVDMLNRYHAFISVDNFFQHLCHYYGFRGVVLFGQSDPEIFGHESNVNLLKSRSLLRPDQFGRWDQAPIKDHAFVDPGEVMRELAAFKFNPVSATTEKKPRKVARRKNVKSAAGGDRQHDSGEPVGRSRSKPKFVRNLRGPAEHG